MLVQDEINIHETNINQKSNNTMSVILCMGTVFIKKNQCLVARIVLFYTVDLLIFRSLEPYPLSTMLSHINDVIIVPSN